jgi:glycerol-3-phosphate responsive antiterminator
MPSRPPDVRLPRVLVATGAHEPMRLPPIGDVGVLYRDIELPSLLGAALSTGGVKAVDLDTVRGLLPDDDGVEFVMNRLSISIVITRRPQTAQHVAELGGLALLHMLAFDSTGVSRSLDSLPRSLGIGAVVSPGLVLPHMLPSEVRRLPRPLLAYGLIMESTDVVACLSLADGVVLGLDVATAVAPALMQVLDKEADPRRNLSTRS